MELEEEIQIASELSIKAGEKIKEIYHKHNYEVDLKADETPITTADKRANEIIVSGLENFNNELKKSKNIVYAILSEESFDDKSRLHKDWCWVVDPLDGTKGFVKRNGDFTVNISLVYQRRPVLGVIYIPLREELYYAVKNKGAYLMKNSKSSKISQSLPLPWKDSFANDNFCRLEVSRRKKNLRVVKSRSHASPKLNDLLARSNNIAEIKKVGSSIKGCLIAKGEAEIYYRFSPCMEWDIAAMDIIINEAGGIMRKLNTDDILYYNNEKNIVDTGFYAINNWQNKLL